jgi:hypothetical protein
MRSITSRVRREVLPCGRAVAVAVAFLRRGWTIRASPQNPAYINDRDTAIENHKSTKWKQAIEYISGVKG